MNLFLFLLRMFGDRRRSNTQSSLSYAVGGDVASRSTERLQAARGSQKTIGKEPAYALHWLLYLQVTSGSSV